MVGVPSRSAPAGVVQEFDGVVDDDEVAGVVIQPSAEAAIHVSSSPVPAAPSGNRDVGLDGFGPRPTMGQSTEFAVVLGDFVGPYQSVHGFEVFAQHGAAPGWGTLFGQFIQCFNRSRHRGDASAGEVIEGWQWIWPEGDGVVFDRVGHGGGEPRAGGDRAGGARATRGPVRIAVVG